MEDPRLRHQKYLEANRLNVPDPKVKAYNKQKLGEIYDLLGKRKTDAARIKEEKEKYVLEETLGHFEKRTANSLEDAMKRAKDIASNYYD